MCRYFHWLYFSQVFLICPYLFLFTFIFSYLSVFTMLFLVVPYLYSCFPYLSSFVLICTVTSCSLFPPYLSLFFTICSLCVLILPLIKFGRLKSVLWARRCLRNVLCKGLCTYVDFQKRILHWTVVWLGFGSSIHENELNLRIVVSNRS